MPHGVLFRGNAEEDIRRTLIRKGYIKGIIGLPPNLFYGTGIPACLVVIDKQDAHSCKGIFMVDASRGFMKDGPKNRLRAQDIHRIVDAFTRQLEIAKYSRMVSFTEIEKNDYNLNLPRYIDSQEPEDIQDIEAHLHGGIPERDIDALERYWKVCPTLRLALFKNNRPGYLDLAVDKDKLKPTIYEHPEFIAFTKLMDSVFAEWRERITIKLKALHVGFHPKELITTLSEDLLAQYNDKPLIDKYDVYQHLMDYWIETMQDDCYLIADEGWKAETYRIIEKDNKGKEKDKGWSCVLIPKPLIVSHYFAKEQDELIKIQAELESITSQISELEEENSGEDGVFSALDNVNRANVTARLKEIRNLFTQVEDTQEEVAVLDNWLDLCDKESALKKKIKDAEATLDAKVYATYPKLSEYEVKNLIVDHKWMESLKEALQAEIDRISQTLTQRIKELAERYETPLPQILSKVNDLEVKVNNHLEKMGFVWNEIRI